MTQDSKPLLILCLGALCERFAYFGIFTILVLKLHSSFNFSDSAAFSLLGIFAALFYSMHVVGGYLGDKWLGQYPGLLIGAALVLIGNALMANSHLHIFYLGLAVITMGTALFKVNCTSLVGKTQPSTNDSGYTLLYVAMNLGALLGPICYGIVGTQWGWAWCFYINIVLFSIVLLSLLKAKMLWQYRVKAINVPIIVAILLGLFVLIALCFFHNLFATGCIAALWLVVVVSMSVYSLKQPPKVKRNLLMLLVYNLGCTIFFACSLQTATTLTLFTQRDISRVIEGVTLPTPIFSALDPLFVVLLAPMFALLWRQLAKRNAELKTTSKIVLGIGLAACAFFSLHLSAIASTVSASHTGLIYLVLAYAFLGAGEICLAPAVLNAINQHAPEKLHSTMMGTWFVFIAIGGLLASQLSKFSSMSGAQVTSLIDSAAIYNHSFLITASTALLGAFGMFCLSYFVRAK
jgi:POT family proton-dependent oligopeptide transporter